MIQLGEHRAPSLLLHALRVLALGLVRLWGRLVVLELLARRTVVGLSAGQAAGPIGDHLHVACHDLLRLHFPTG